MALSFREKNRFLYEEIRKGDLKIMNYFSDTAMLIAFVMLIMITAGCLTFFGWKLLSRIANYIRNFIEWQRFRKKKDDFNDFDDYED